MAKLTSREPLLPVTGSCHPLSAFSCHCDNLSGQTDKKKKKKKTVEGFTGQAEHTDMATILQTGFSLQNILINLNYPQYTNKGLVHNQNEQRVNLDGITNANSRAKL